MSIHFLNSDEKKEIEAKLREQFGISKLPETLVRTGKEKIKLFTGEIDKHELEILSQITFIEGIGVYVMKEESGEIRLSIEGSQIFAEQIKKNIHYLENEEQLKIWMEGADLQIKNDERGTFIIKYKNDFLGSGKKSAEKISNFIPKGRRIKPN